MPRAKQTYAQASTGAVAGAFPSQAERPTYCNYPTSTKIGSVDYPAGVYYHTIGESNGQKFPIDHWVCAPLGLGGTPPRLLSCLTM